MVIIVDDPHLVEVTRVAEWAGHSIAVLLRVYAKFIDGGEQTARARVEEALQGRQTLPRI